MTSEHWGIHTLYRDVESLADGVEEPDDKSDFRARARTIAQALHLSDIDRHLREGQYAKALDLIRAEWKDGAYPQPYEEHAPTSD